MKRLNNLTDLADLLRSIDNSETSEMGFDMKFSYRQRKDSLHPCGTACCIGGWIQHVNGNEGEGLVRSLLSICPESTSEHEAAEVCFPHGVSCYVSNPYEATPEQAARVIEILRDTGKCDWDEALKM